MIHRQNLIRYTHDAVFGPKDTFDGELWGISLYGYSTYCPADFPSLQSNLSDCIRMFVSWFDSPLLAWNPMFELNEVCFEMCWGYMGHDGPFFCLSVFSPWHPRVLIGGRAHVFVGPRDSRDSRQGTEESTRNAECPWDLVSKSCFPRNVHLNVLMFVVPAMISLIETSGPIYMLHYVAVFPFGWSTGRLHLDPKCWTNGLREWYLLNNPDPREAHTPW